MRAITLVLFLAVAHSCYGAAVLRHNVCNGYINGVKLPNMEDCGSFYVCDHGVPKLFRCDPRTLYDPELETCNWAQYVNCGQYPMPEPQFPGDVNPPQNGIPQPPMLPQEPQVPQTPEIPSGSSESFIPPSLISEAILPSMEVNSVEQPSFEPPIHNQPEEGNNELVPETVDPNNQEEDCGCDQQNPNEATEDHNKPEHIPIPNLPELIGSGEGAENIDGLICLKDGFYFVPHPHNCEQYYICENRKIHAHQCGNGVHWDYVLNQCEVPERAICYASVTGNADESTATAAPPTAPTEAPTAPTEAPAEPTVPQINPVTDEPEPLCSGDSEYIPHAKDCRKYFICIAGMAIETSCPENHYWNAEGLFCTDKEKANCTV